MEYFR